MAENRTRRGAVVDGRGRSVKPLDPVGLHLLRRHDVIPAPLLRQIALDVDPKWTKYGYFIILLNLSAWLLCSGGIAAYMLFRSGNSIWDPVPLLILAVQFVLMFGSMVGMWYAARKMRFPYFVRALLKHKRCASCGYDLQGLAAHNDGSVACPECGSFWLLTAPEVVEFDGAATVEKNRSKQAAGVVLGLLTLALFGGVLFSFMNARRMQVGGMRVRPTAAVTQPAPPAASRPVLDGSAPIRQDE